MWKHYCSVRTLKFVRVFSFEKKVAKIIYSHSMKLFHYIIWFHLCYPPKFFMSIFCSQIFRETIRHWYKSVLRYTYSFSLLQLWRFQKKLLKTIEKWLAWENCEWRDGKCSRKNTSSWIPINLIQWPTRDRMRFAFGLSYFQLNWKTGKLLSLFEKDVSHIVL